LTAFRQFAGPAAWPEIVCIGLFRVCLAGPSRCARFASQFNVFEFSELRTISTLIFATSPGRGEQTGLDCVIWCLKRYIQACYENCLS
jgi:hypothetical protein